MLAQAVRSASMRPKGRQGRAMQRILLAFAVAGMLGGCSTGHYQNVSHPTYGDAEYKADLAQCRNQNSKIVMSTGYDDRSDIQVDEAKARSCMTDRGWQPAST
jgi:uncharacterized protein YceK